MTTTADHIPPLYAPSALGALVVKDLDGDLLGEVLRALFFQGEGFGCYHTFEPHPDARQWTLEESLGFWTRLGDGDQEWISFAAEHGDGYTWPLGGLLIDVAWSWDGDGCLSIRVRHGNSTVRWVTNNDCKKDYGWKGEL